MTGPHDRRGFLRGLPSLPLVGGSVALLGQPTAAVVPATHGLLRNYGSWLFMERRLLSFEMYGEDRQYHVPNTTSGHFHGEEVRAGIVYPSSRPAVILSAAGAPLEP
ncbi:hypothetical protein [Enterovirga rhinocerotis]|uniref:Uncharacterized protein n=1 Tax=Enterovirga rhinocerotis TaxID=1339210 RepID=A0A4R7C6M4_9HYPH|nr:hypothetical protein [Enterovirga rhinocerotis]TDR94048.1 hypothetical protein EV668_1319 [Enterovirga rhinocerotis]